MQTSEPLSASTSENTSAPTGLAFPISKQRRAVQLVLNHTQKGKIVSWMIENAQQDGEKHICSRTVSQFPQYFRGSTKANLQRASRYWKSRETVLSRYKNKSRKNGTVITRCTAGGLKTYITKVSTGRGRKREPWVQIVHKELLEEFDRFRKAGVRFNISLLRTLARQIVNSGDNNIYGPLVTDSRSGKLLSELITKRWIQGFMQSNDIVCRSQCGKLLVSPAKRELIEREVAYHLGQLSREFTDKTLNENDVMNADETHFVINMHNHKTLCRRGDDDVKYADVVSGEEGMTMLVLITGGGYSSIHPPFMIFKNENSSYPIRGVPDEVPGVSYRTGQKGWMDSRVFGEWLNENRAVPVARHERKRVLYVDNCSGHAVTNEVKDALRKKNIELRFFPANATDLVQPADSHLIQKVKAAWRARWDNKVLDMIAQKMWADPRKGSGKLVNPGKLFFLELAANAVRDVNGATHKDGMFYSRRAMIRCGLSLNTNGKWETKQLSKELQAIIEKYRENFDGKPVCLFDDLKGERTETDEEQ